MYKYEYDLFEIEKVVSFKEEFFVVKLSNFEV